MATTSESAAPRKRSKTAKVTEAVASTARVITSFVGLEDEYQDFMNSVASSRLEVRVINDVLNVFARGKLREKVKIALELNSEIVKKKRELTKLEDELRQYGSDFRDNWRKINPGSSICSSRLIPTADEEHYSILVTVKDTFSFAKEAKEAVAAMKEQLSAIVLEGGKTLYDTMFTETVTHNVKDELGYELLSGLIEKYLGKEAVTELVETNVDVSLNADKFAKLMESDVIPAELKTKLSLVIAKQKPAITYPK